MSFDIAPIQLPIVPLSWFCAQLLRKPSQRESMRRCTVQCSAAQGVVRVIAEQ